MFISKDHKNEKIFFVCSSSTTENTECHQIYQQGYFLNKNNKIKNLLYSDGESNFKDVNESNGYFVN